MAMGGMTAAEFNLLSQAYESRVLHTVKQVKGRSATSGKPRMWNHSAGERTFRPLVEDVAFMRLNAVGKAPFAVFVVLPRG